MVWRISQDDVEIYKRELWKDLRKFPRNSAVSKNVFVKDCLNEDLMKVELAAIEIIGKNSQEKICPDVSQVHGNCIHLEKIRGIRVFDLLRTLRSLEFESRCGRAQAVTDRLFARCRARLEIVQRALLNLEENLSFSPYPMEEKLSSIVYLLARILDVRVSEQCDRELVTFANYWTENCNLIPFRDATTKNMIFADPVLELSNDSEELQRISTLVSKITEVDVDYWESTPIIDIDFSSAIHRTSPEDDVLSLHFHEWTYGSQPLTAQALNLLPDIFTKDAYRAAATLMVRYIRFGGRKLAYKIINPQGFEVRFRYDNPFFYFKGLSRRCGELSTAFVEDYKTILVLLEKIGYEAENPSESDKYFFRFDHFRKYTNEEVDYWQENPLESE
ncbi:MAG: hypothetical protein AAF431_05310 [Pseudomonadota bacterium]